MPLFITDTLTRRNKRRAEFKKLHTQFIVIVMQKSTPTIFLTSRSGQLGGMELRLADEARFFSDIGHRCILAPSKFPGRNQWMDAVLANDSSLSMKEFNPPPFFEEWNWRRLNRLFATAIHLRLLKSWNISLSHIMYAWTQEGGSRLWLSHKAGIPAVLSIHNAFPKAEFSRWHEKMTADSFASVRGIYAVSQSALSCFMASYDRFVRPGTVIDVIPNFVDISRYAPSKSRRASIRKSLGIPENSPVIGSIGRLDNQKKPFSVLEIFSTITKIHPGAHLIFCGQGPLAEAVKAESIRFPWRNQVHFLGFRNDTESVMAALDVHLLLSQQEGFGIVNAEAMACEIPSVATNVPGTCDAFKGSGAAILVPYDNNTIAAEAVSILLSNKEKRISMGAAGRKHASQYLSKDAWREMIFNFYNRSAPELFRTNPIAGT